MSIQVNYPPTAEPMGLASGVADSLNGNASSNYCFISQYVVGGLDTPQLCYETFRIRVKVPHKISVTYV